jgi:mono/diheme cytochrome c family protein
MGAGGMAPMGATFADVHPIFVASCGGTDCHGAGADDGTQFAHGEYGNPDQTVAQGYIDDTIDMIITRITSTNMDANAFGMRRMPPPGMDGLSEEDIAKVQAYADSL